MDGNVTRVMSRIRVIGAEANSLEATRHIWFVTLPVPQSRSVLHSMGVLYCRSLAEEAVDPTRPGDFNQVLHFRDFRLPHSSPAVSIRIIHIYPVFHSTHALLHSGTDGARCYCVYSKEAILSRMSSEYHLWCLPSGVWGRVKQARIAGSSFLSGFQQEGSWELFHSSALQSRGLQLFSCWIGDRWRGRMSVRL